MDVKRKTIDYTLADKKHGVYGRRDMRGKSTSANKLDYDTVKLVNQHIESFPKMEVTIQENLKETIPIT